MGFVILAIYGLIISPILDRKAEQKTKEKIVLIEAILNENFLNTNMFPAHLSDVINNNPLERNKITDEWNNEFHYELTKDTFCFQKVETANKKLKMT